MRQVTLDHPGTLKEKPLKIAEARGFSTEETAWGQEIQWQKGRLRTSSVNKVRRPGGPGTGASTHRVPVMPGQHLGLHVCQF